MQSSSVSEALDRPKERDEDVATVNKKRPRSHELSQLCVWLILETYTKKISSRKFWFQPIKKDFLLALIMMLLPSWMTSGRLPCGLMKHVWSFRKKKWFSEPSDFPEIPASEPKLRKKFPNPMVDLCNKDKINNDIFGFELQ